MALANDSAKDVNLTQQGHSTACGCFVRLLLLPAPPPLAVVVGRQSFCCFASSLVSMVMVDDALRMDFCREKNFKFFFNFFDVGEKTENVKK